MYKFRDYEFILKQNCISYFVEIVEMDNIEKKETIMKKEHTQIPLPPLDVPCAYINVKAGATVPVPGKRFHSARIDIGLSYPCHPKEIDDVFDKVKQWVDDRMYKEYQEMTNGSEVENG